jgi:hypothetical protein
MQAQRERRLNDWQRQTDGCSLSFSTRRTVLGLIEGEFQGCVKQKKLEPQHFKLIFQRDAPSCLSNTRQASNVNWIPMAGSTAVLKSYFSRALFVYPPNLYLRPATRPPIPLEAAKSGPGCAHTWHLISHRAVYATDQNSAMRCPSRTENRLSMARNNV